MSPLEKAARALADGMGDNFDHAFANKSEWIAARGQKGGRDRDVNEPFQYDYVEGARAVLLAVREPGADAAEAGSRTEGWGCTPELDREAAAATFTTMINQILSNPTGREG